MIAFSPMAIHSTFQIVPLYDDVVARKRSVAARRSGAKERDQRSAGGGGQMRRTRIASDKKSGSSGQLIELPQRRLYRQGSIRLCVAHSRGCESFFARTVRDN
jgi:hypothetical protein